MSNYTSSFISNVFSSVVDNYDLMNDAMSFGIHRMWKNELVKKISPVTGGKVLDVAGGTGDISFRIAKKYPLDITICDINYDMVEKGRDRAIDCNYLDINWICGNAESLPITDNTFDFYTIAFGIRNVVDRISALQEAYRVLKPGGKFICLEFFPLDDTNVFKKIYNVYSFYIIPKIGAVLAKNEDAYRYLVESIQLFPKQTEFYREIELAGFKNISFSDMTFGVVSLFTAWKI